MKSLVEQQKINFKHLAMRVFESDKLVLSQSTPYQVIAQFKQTRVRFYASENKRYKEPLVFVAPLAINMDIYDLYPYRSLVKHFQESGYDVYLIDWGKLTYKNYQINFLSFIDKFIPRCIEAIQQHSKSQKISLHGWSMAGIFVTLYTARHQPNAVKNLIVLGSPIDSYASGYIGKLYKTLAYVTSRNPTVKDYIYNRLPKLMIHSPGFLNSLGFKLLDPKGWLDGNIQLLKNLDNLKLVQEDATLSHFLNNMIDYPGGINQDMLFNVWMQNPLKNGAITLKNKTIVLKNIDCSLFVGAGKGDQMVTANAAFPLTQLTSSRDVTFTLIPGGHLGLMSSQKSSIEFWPTLTDWLAERSTPIKR
ncbi:MULTISPECIES: alpha/beta fold hydrolase [Acinetobacter]|uniref:alpha/beta fold hydrolase n=1 Tax=Acinetobacter TaxID=469 RepID=UPI000C684BFD|nr:MULTISPECIES: alpha/beta fold hydrolase [Acinetobacter]MEC8568516.1 alpha/beta fold hydrolase [Pseudomonadota bacterium]MBC69716.1 alpha/beta hydrolase [Acinetobacter sp.]MBT50875.1 alpha/beta hydrolase [Acinetobacter sp.]HIQ33508.1 alpha/beta fold hydrolase [Acinetobacter venetianus]HJP49305.1 alpha/beta fold hydrolase [Acinetobacter venetianus]|tara:strand:- start:1508 stop:2593 length:1086 start_codon:yes stop_codon:yes gene_type:complete